MKSLKRSLKNLDIRNKQSAQKGKYRIYSINLPGRLLNFWTLRVGAYSTLGAY